ncbi:MAG: hypothetical protein ABI690_22610 [Chloroflexota bacterium]
MYTISPLSRRMGAWNWWLWKVYRHRTLLAELLLHAGYTQDEVNTLKAEHLEAFFDTMVDYLRSVDDSKDAGRRHEVMVRHFGLKTGWRETLQSIGNDHELSRERIRQLVAMRMTLFQNDEAREKLEAQIKSLAGELLASKKT